MQTLHVRKAILEAAEKRLKEKTTIVSEADIKDIQTGRIRLKLVTLFDGSQVEMNIPTATPVKNRLDRHGQALGRRRRQQGRRGPVRALSQTPRGCRRTRACRRRSSGSS
jgi:hypothetical protein